MASRYYYLRDLSKTERNVDGSPKTRGVPVAVIKTSVNRDTNEIHFAFAIANPKDGFVKSTARMIVSGRLEKHPFVIPGVPGNGHDISKVVVRSFLDQEGIPMRVRKLALNWLARAELPKDQQYTIPAPSRRASTMAPPPAMRA